VASLPLLLAVDAGNTSVTVGLFRGSRLLRRGRMPTATASGLDRELGARLAAAVGLGGNSAPLSGAATASVVPGLDRKLATAVASFGCPVFSVTPSSPLGLTLKVRTPREVGADRIVNALAARELVGIPSLVVDIGTAVTVDCVTAEGAYGGGSIMPGPGMAAEALRDRTAKLPYVEPARVRRAIGTDTESCIRAGLYFGCLGMVRGMVEKTLEELGGGPAKVVVTGGFAGLYGRGLGPDYCIMPDLTLQGLRPAFGILSGGGMRC
jgi:type III pantothenate kinase